MRTMKSPTTTTQPASRRGFWIIAVLVALALVIAGGWLLLRSDEKTTDQRLKDVTAAMRNDDMTELTEIFGFDDTDSTEYRFIAWHVGWDAHPEFTDVVETPGNGDRTNFRAVVTYADDSFYAKAAGETLTTTVTGWMEDGTVHVSSWPPPATLGTTEAALRPWVDANRPELVDEMFGFDYSGIHFSGRSGELRIEVLEDFLASR